MLIASLAILGASFLLQFGESGKLAPSWLPEVSLPTLCASRAWWGVECPGCGLTRSFVALSAGDFAASLQFHRFGWLLYAAVIAQLPYRAYRLRADKLNGDKFQEPAWPTWFGYALIAALVGNWLWKLVF